MKKALAKIQKTEINTYIDEFDKSKTRNTSPLVRSGLKRRLQMRKYTSRLTGNSWKKSWMT